MDVIKHLRDKLFKNTTVTAIFLHIYATFWLIIPLVHICSAVINDAVLSALGPGAAITACCFAFAVLVYTSSTFAKAARGCVISFDECVIHVFILFNLFIGLWVISFLGVNI